MNPSFTTGSKLPLGSSPTEKGINFAVYSHHATNIKLRLFEIGQVAPFAEFPMERSGDYWHLCVANLPSTFEYTYQVEGPYDP
ncbi:MAG: glycogen debranching enzyme, partial [Simkania sp.]|nr:glycogen debranching enzyme [Simkania sp.]